MGECIPAMDDQPVMQTAAPSAVDDQPSAVVFEVDAIGSIVDVSSSCQALLGWAVRDLIGTPLTRVIPERFHEAHRAGFRRFLETGEMALEGGVIRVPAVHAIAGEIDVELELRRCNGRGRAVALGTLSPIENGAPAPSSDLADVVQEAIVADLPLGELVHRCLAAAARRHGWAVAAVWWIDPWMDRLRAIAIWEAVPGQHPRYAEQTSATVFAVGQGLVGQAWATGVPTFHDDLATESQMLRDVAITEDGLHGGLFFPLTAGGETVGVVEMLDSERRQFSIDDQEAVWVLADELGRLVADRLRREHEAVQRNRVRMALSAGRMGVWSYHIETGIVTWDEQLERLHGLPSGAFGGSFEDLTDHIHSDDREETVARLREAIESGDRFNHQFRSVHADGSVIWLQTAATPVHDTDGHLQALTGVMFDVTERIESQNELDERAQHAALAADVGRSLVSRDELSVRLRQTVEAVVERIDAAFARIWIVEPGSDTLELQASAGLYTHLDGDHSSIPIGQFKIGSIAATREPHLTNDVLNDELISHPEWARAEGMVAFAGYPLVAGEQLVGVLGLFARKPLPQSTLDALASIADTVAIAILQSWAFNEMELLMAQARHTAIEMEAAMRDRAYVAEVLQGSLLPPSLPKVPDVALHAAYRAGVEAVGGDFYDVLPLPTGWAFMVGDVCGRGPEAARLTALARHSLRTAMLLGFGPADALKALNESLLVANAEMRFCTVACGVFEVLADGDGNADDKWINVTLSIGGHPLPYLIHADGSVESVGVPGTLLGVLDNPSNVDRQVRLSRGDVLVLYTDGVTEAKNESGLFGEERLKSLLGDLTDRSPSSVVERIVDVVTDFATEAADDLAVLAIGMTDSE